MEVITSHINADFDAFASMVAAKKLYPNAQVAFPGSQEKGLRDFFIESTMYLLSIEKARDIDLSKVTRLILVDTRQKSRIGRFADLVESSDVDIHIYDHHPDSDDDVSGSLEIVKEVGATTSIMIEEIKKRGLDLNAEEATILALGIYEDTGCFTFQSTTTLDLQAATWLLEKGVILNTLANMLSSDLNAEQVEVLHQMIRQSEDLNLEGVDIRITSASLNAYVGDLAALVHKFRDMEGLDCVFALIRMEDRVYMIARSRLDEVNVGEIAAEFGGGGHAGAASATIKDMSLYQVKESVRSLLRERVTPKSLAGEIMSRPVYTVTPDETIAHSESLLRQYQVSSLPVVNDGRVLGVLHRYSVEKAVHHGLNDAKVSEYYNPGAVSISPLASIEEALDLAVEGRQRLVCVIDNGVLVGVISRSDLLEHMKLPRAKDTDSPDQFPENRMKTKSVKRLMEEQIPKWIIQALKIAGEVADERGEDVYLVGGAVRDLLLRRSNLDIDLVLEGDGIAFTKELAAKFKGSRVKGHEAFGTAQLIFENEFKMDVATARYEYYSGPGALPTVETSSIKRDLYRRDFTMNMLAVGLNPGKFGQVLDFFGGARDTKDRVIRVLNNLSFVEDPTRILRAVRFSCRFNFTIGKHTTSLMKTAIKMKVFDRVEGRRLLNEFIHIFEENNPIPNIAMMEEFGIGAAIHPALTIHNSDMDLMEEISRVMAWRRYSYEQDNIQTWVVYFMAMTDSASDKDLGGVLVRLGVPGAAPEKIVRERINGRKALAMFARGRVDRPSAVYTALEKLSIETLLYMMAKTEQERTARNISEYLGRLRHVKPLITGRELIDMGYKPGPKFGLILNTVRDFRLDNKVKTIKDELDLVKRLFPMERALESTEY